LVFAVADQRLSAGEGAAAKQLEWSPWPGIPEIFRQTQSALPRPWEELFGALRKGAVDDLVLIGQCGQSIDGRIATPSGDSHYINGEAGLDHLHRLRSLVDAVVIGAGTAIADDPQLTVRRVAGANPARIVIDPQRRLPSTARALREDGIRRIVITARSGKTPVLPGVEIVPLADDGGQLSHTAIAGALRERGFHRILIEGGADTVSRFLAAQCLDRLHILVAPIILGAGRSSLTLAPLQRARDALCVPMRAHRLWPSTKDPIDLALDEFNRSADILLDCDLSGHRLPIGRANMST
jgi:diaminohydroxyphosphoribosylaminopyrimidine deaminase/5-amino-6-(5-phosphoribosylamino)uracil reductase